VYRTKVRKFLDDRILEVPLIVLQYYKPSIFLYIYISIKSFIYIEGQIVIYYLQFNYAKLLKLCGCKACQRNCKFIYNFDSADLLRFKCEALKFGRMPMLTRF
jgi:hypothetical protein